VKCLKRRTKKKKFQKKTASSKLQRNPILEQKDCATCIQSNVELLATTEKPKSKRKDNRAA
jgi:hypothetical protein